MTPLLALVFLSSPWIDSKDFPRARQEAALNATLRIVTKDPRGEATAIRIGRQQPFVYYLTANHIVEKVAHADLQAYSSATFPEVAHEIEQATIIHRWPEFDLALLQAHEQKPPGFLRIAPNHLLAKPPFAVLTVGCTDGKVPQLKTDRVQKLIHGKTETGLRGKLWESEKAPSEGRSGGPMIDANGNLVGICNGTSDGKGYYLQFEEIRLALKRVGLEQLTDFSIQSTKSKK